jgi:hypothetical protein
LIKVEVEIESVHPPYRVTDTILGVLNTLPFERVIVRVIVNEPVIEKEGKPECPTSTGEASPEIDEHVAPPR